VIEEVEEDKNNNNNTNMVKSEKFNDDNKNNINENKNVNIKIVKEDKNEEKDIKKGFRKGNKFNQMYKSLALSKEKKLNKINIIENENYNYASNGIDFKNKSNNIESSTGDKQYPKNDNISKINLPLLYKPSNISSKNKFPNNINNETPSTSAYTNSTKNNLRNDHNLTEQVTKFRIGLFSANSSSNNAIIPILPIKRPVSNFNFGGNQLWEKDDSNKDNKIFNNNNEILIEKEIEPNKEPKMKNINLNKYFDKNKTRDIFKSTDSKYKSTSFNNRFEKISNNINLKSKMTKLTKEKGQDNFFNMKLIEFKKMPSYLNKNSNFFRSRNGNKSHSVKKFE
jgi:hypothetical protein